MFKRLTSVSALVLSLGMAAPAFAQDTMTADSVVATVNGTEITLGHLIMIRASLPEQYQQLPDDVLFNGILDQVVQQTVLGQQPEAVESRKVQVALENERRTLLAAEVVSAKVAEAVTDETVQAFYEENYLNNEPEVEFNASHILVETEEKAAELIETLSGGADFAELAREESTGPSGPNGGELGWFGPGMMVAPFQQAVEAMEVGAVSGPVQTQFGWHVIKLNEKRNKEAPPLEEIRFEIESQLSQQAVTTYIEGLTDAAEVTRLSPDEIDTSILNNLNLLEE